MHGYFTQGIIVINIVPVNIVRIFVVSIIFVKVSRILVTVSQENFTLDESTIIIKQPGPIIFMIIYILSSAAYILIIVFISVITPIFAKVVSNNFPVFLMTHNFTAFLPIFSVRYSTT